MEREREQSNKASSEDESQFTDLLFGDLEEIPLNSDKPKVEDNEQERPALWHDDDDDVVQVSLKDKNRTRKLRREEDEDVISGTEFNKRLRLHISTTNNVDSLFKIEKQVDTNDDVAALLRTTKRFIGSVKALPSERLEIQKLSEFDLREDNGEAASTKNQIRFVRFHRSEPLFLTLNHQNYIHIYRIEKNEPICQKVLHLSNFIVHQVCWTSKNTLLMTSKNREFILYYDIERDTSSRIYNVPGYQEMKKGVMCVSPDGRIALLLSSKGSVLTVDLQTRHITTVKQLASPICDGCFYDNSTCYFLTKENMISEYDVIENTVRANYWDKDLFGGQTLCVNGNFMAVGDAAGILSIYNTPTQLNTVATKESYREIKPLRTLKNLVTAITSVDINNDNSLLVYASDDKMEAVRAVHLGTFTAFSNWPDKTAHMGYINSLSLSGDNQYLVLGNRRGTVTIYRFNHFYHLNEESYLSIDYGVPSKTGFIGGTSSWPPDASSSRTVNTIVFVLERNVF